MARHSKAPPGVTTRTHPLMLLVCGLFRLATGTYRFDRTAVGGIFTMEDGLHFRVFRRVIHRRAGQRPAGAAFKVRFKPIGMGVEQNIRFSRFPMILMLGFPGFRAKFWTVEDATGLCMGIYEWATVADARRYAASVAMKFMAGRSQPGSVSHEVIDQSVGRYWACEGPLGKSQAQ